MDHPQSRTDATWDIACVVFEDQFVDQLRPMNLARPTFAVTCGALDLRTLLAERTPALRYHVRPHLRRVVERDYGPLPERLEGPVLYVNAALAPSLSVIDRLAELVAKREPFLALNDQRLTAALCPGPFPDELVGRTGADLQAFILDQRATLIDDEFPTLGHTFDVLGLHETFLPDHLQYLIAQGDYEERRPGVYVGKGTEIASNVVCDASDGPVLLGAGVRVAPFSLIAGPVRIGDRCRIIDHASIKHGAVLGHTVKAGGEIEASIMEPFGNKQHHGFLGHAYVGSWCNLGAGTSNSDLKNTYGEIAIDRDGESIPTGMQFLGCVIGDYTKTAINTSIFTGKHIGPASYLYGFIGANVPAFTNYARTFGQVTEVSVDVAIKTQTRAAKRRDVTLTDVDRQLLCDLFELTRRERQLSSEQVVL